MARKTLIIVAHRISTIEDSDVIYVMNDGIIVENGRYVQLVSQEGFFYKLVKRIQINQES